MVAPVLLGPIVLLILALVIAACFAYDLWRHRNRRW
jgi:hypothetical protein